MRILEYFGLETLKVVVRQPLAATDTEGKFDVIVNVKGGGYTGQAGAIRHGVARALLSFPCPMNSTRKKRFFSRLLIPMQKSGLMGNLFINTEMKNTHPNS